MHLTHQYSKKSRLFDPVLFTLTKSMTLQSFIKHLLTEGDKVAVARTSKLADQGGYAVASNYGTLTNHLTTKSKPPCRITSCSNYIPAI